jgi:hypothetical protein
VKLQVTPSGFTSECSCPAFPKINGHCKHVAALLIALRDQVRPKQPRPENQNGARAGDGGGGGGGGGLGAPPPSGPSLGGGHGTHSSHGGHGGGHGGHLGGDMDAMGGSRRARRRARKLAAQRMGGGGGGGAPMLQGGRPGYTVDGRHERGGSTNGVDAWLPEPMPPAPKTIEYRMQVRPGALSISLLDRRSRCAARARAPRERRSAPRRHRGPR